MTDSSIQHPPQPHAHPIPPQVPPPLPIVSAQVRELVDALELHRRLREFEDQERARAKEKKEEERGSTSLGALNIVSFVLVGGAMGLLCGLSSSPVVATLLPLLFALLGGASGLYLVVGDAVKKGVSQRMRLMGAPTILFVIVCLFGIGVGISIRTGAALEEMLPTLKKSPAVPDATLDGLSLDEQLQLIALRARLGALRLSDQEQKALLTQAHNMAIQSPEAHFPTQQYAAWIAALEGAAKDLGGLKFPSAPRAPTPTPQQLALAPSEDTAQDAIRKLIRKFQTTVQDAKAWEKGSARSRVELLREEVSPGRLTLSERADEVLASPENTEVRSKVELVRVTGKDLYQALGGDDRLSGKDGQSAVDGALEILFLGKAPLGLGPGSIRNTSVAATAPVDLPARF